MIWGREKHSWSTAEAILIQQNVPKYCMFLNSHFLPNKNSQTFLIASSKICKFIISLSRTFESKKGGWEKPLSGLWQMLQKGAEENFNFLEVVMPTFNWTIALLSPQMFICIQLRLKFNPPSVFLYWRYTKDLKAVTYMGRGLKC